MMHKRIGCQRLLGVSTLNQCIIYGRYVLENCLYSAIGILPVTHVWFYFSDKNWKFWFDSIPVVNKRSKMDLATV